MRRLVYVFCYIAVLGTLAFSLTACTNREAIEPGVVTKSTKTPDRGDAIPASTFECAGEPDGSSVATNYQVADYIEELKDAGRDCRRKLKTVGAVIQGKASLPNE